MLKKSFCFSLAIIAAVFFAACGHNSKTATAAPDVATVLQVDDVLAAADSLVGDTVTFEGVCTHICKHAGRKIFLMGSDDTQTIRIESASLGSFKPECVNHIVTVTGVVREDRIDEAYLQRWEAQLAARTAEEHGNGGAAGCDTEKKARQENADTPEGRIADFRARIAKRMADEGKDYLSFYHIDAVDYKIAD